MRLAQRFGSYILSATAVLLFSATPFAANAAPPQYGPGVLTGVATAHRVIALTFDDGPSTYTPAVMGVLRRMHVHATFFMVGWEVVQSPAVVRSIAASHDEIGNHTFSHPDLQRLSDAGVRAELLQTNNALRSITGHRPGWFRPPYDLVDGRITHLAASLGLRTVTWNDDPQDWSLPGSGAIVARALGEARPGGIILLHDGGGYRGETIAALPPLIAALRARGYTLVTLSQLFFPRRRRA